MTIRRLRILPAHTYVAGLLILFLTQADMHLRRTNWLPIPPTVAFLVLVFPLVSVIYIRGMLSHRTLSTVLALYKRNRIIVLPFMAVVFFSLLFALHPTAHWAEGGTYIFLPTYDFLILLLAMLLPLSNFVRRGFRIYVVIALLALLLTIAADMLFLAFYIKERSRVAGIAGNANQTAFLIVIMSAVVLRYDRVRLFDLLVLALSGVGVYVTLSRAGAVLFLLEMLAYGYFVVGFKRFRPGRVMVATLSIVALVVCIFLVAQFVVQEWRTSGFVGKYITLRRLAIFTGGRGFIASTVSYAARDSLDIRFSLIKESLDIINDSPLIGHGTGFTHTLVRGPHNMYLQQWIDGGLFGLMSYLGLVLAGSWLFYARRFPAGTIFIVIVAVNGLFNHNILDSRPFLILFGMLCTMSLMSKNVIAKQTSQAI